MTWKLKYVSIRRQFNKEILTYIISNMEHMFFCDTFTYLSYNDAWRDITQPTWHSVCQATP